MSKKADFPLAAALGMSGNSGDAFAVKKNMRNFIKANDPELANQVFHNVESGANDAQKRTVATLIDISGVKSFSKDGTVYKSIKAMYEKRRKEVPNIPGATPKSSGDNPPAPSNDEAKKKREDEERRAKEAKKREEREAAEAKKREEEREPVEESESEEQDSEEESSGEQVPFPEWGGSYRKDEYKSLGISAATSAPTRKQRILDFIQANDPPLLAQLFINQESGETEEVTVKEKINSAGKQELNADSNIFLSVRAMYEARRGGPVSNEPARVVELERIVKAEHEVILDYQAYVALLIESLQDVKKDGRPVLNDELNEQIREAGRNQQTLRSERDEAVAKVSELQSSKEAMRVQLNKQLEQAVSAKQSIEKQVEGLLKSQDRLDIDLDKREEEIEELEELNEKLEREKKNAMDAQSTAEDRVIDLELDLAQANKEREKDGRELEKLKDTLAKEKVAHETAKKSAARVLELEKQLDASKATIATLQSTAGGDTKLTQLLKEEQEKVEKQTKKIRELDDIVAGLETRVEIIEEARDTAVNDLEEAKRVNASNKTTGAEKTQLEQVVQESGRKIASLQKDLAEARDALKQTQEREKQLREDNKELNTRLNEVDVGGGDTRALKKRVDDLERRISEESDAHDAQIKTLKEQLLAEQTMSSVFQSVANEGRGGGGEPLASVLEKGLALDSKAKDLEIARLQQELRDTAYQLEPLRTAQFMSLDPATREIVLRGGTEGKGYVIIDGEAIDILRKHWPVYLQLRITHSSDFLDWHDADRLFYAVRDGQKAIHDFYPLVVSYEMFQYIAKLEGPANGGNNNNITETQEEEEIIDADTREYKARPLMLGDYIQMAHLDAQKLTVATGNARVTVLFTDGERGEDMLGFVASRLYAYPTTSGGRSLIIDMDERSGSALNLRYTHMSGMGRTVIPNEGVFTVIVEDPTHAGEEPYRLRHEYTIERPDSADDAHAYGQKQLIKLDNGVEVLTRYATSDLSQLKRIIVPYDLVYKGGEAVEDGGEEEQEEQEVVQPPNNPDVVGDSGTTKDSTSTTAVSVQTTVMSLAPSVKSTAVKPTSTGSRKSSADVYEIVQYTSVLPAGKTMSAKKAAMDYNQAALDDEFLNW